MTTETQTSPEGAAVPYNGRYALVITLDRVEPAFYTGWEGNAKSVEHDRSSMLNLLNSAEFAVTALENKKATRKAVIDAFAKQADQSKAGDQVVVYFSGHGVTLPDLNGDEPGVLRDGAWCLHDGMFVDDEVSEALTNFRDGVRVVLISDSCYSGTIVAPDTPEEREQGQTLVNDRRGSKLAPVDIGERVYEAQQRFYDPILERSRPKATSSKAAVLVLSACDKDELARVHNNGGSLFTEAIVRTWRLADSPLTYEQLFVKVREEVKRSVAGQTPQKFLAGNQPDQLEQELAFGGPPRGPTLADQVPSVAPPGPPPGIPGGFIEREAPPARYGELY